MNKPNKVILHQGDGNGCHFRVSSFWGNVILLPPDVPGDHTRGQNEQSIAVCIAGNFDEVPPVPPHWNSAVELVAWICRQWSLGPDDIYGVCNFEKNTGPGLKFNLQDFRADVGKVVAP